MKDFFNYCRRYTKSRFFKFLLFFIVFCIISLVKSCDVHAWSIISQYSNSNSTISYTFGELERFGLNDLYTKRTFTLTNTFNNNEPVAYEFKKLTYYNLMYITIDYKLTTTFSSADTGYKYISLNMNNFILGGSSPKFDFYSSATGNEDISTWNNLYHFQPFSAEIYNTDTSSYQSVDVRVYSWDNNLGGHTQYILVMPTNVHFNELIIRFGDLRNLVSSEIVLNSNMYPSDDHLGSYWYYSHGYTFRSDIYQQMNEYENNYLGLIFAPIDLSVSNFVAKPSSNTNTNNEFSIISRSSSLPITDYFKKVYNFSGVDYTDYYNQIQSENEEQLQEIQEEIAKQEEIEKANNDLSSSMSSFTDSNNGTAFTGLFSSLFVYPLQKMNEIKNEDLTFVNTGGVTNPNLGLCVGSSSAGVGWNDRFRIHITDDDYFEFPCPHYDIYPKVHSRNYYFMGNGTNSFQFYYQIVIRGILVYLLFVTCLNIYKYILDINDTKVEVLEL